MGIPLRPCERIRVTRGSTDGASQALFGSVTPMPNRQRLEIQNTHATQTLYVGTTATATTADRKVAPAGGVVDWPLGDVTGTLTCIGSGAATTYTLTEMG